MGLFGRKKQSPAVSEKEEIEKVKKEIQPQHAYANEDSFNFEQEKPNFTPATESEKPTKPILAPLFIKVDRYRDVIDLIGELRATMSIMKNTFLSLSELDRIRAETVEVIASAMTKVENKLSALDSSLIRPTGFEEVENKTEYQDVEAIEHTISNLKVEVDKLKNELKQIA